jgi:hypothetical protein
MKWLSKEVSRAAKAARLAAEELRQNRQAAAGPKDLGALELDTATGVYRPTRKVG